MKSKKVIELLKELDPSGNLQVTLGKEAISFMERLPGYYDGNYTYLDKKKFIISDKKEKILIRTTDLELFIWENEGKIDKVNLDIEVPKDYLERMKEIQIECMNFNEESSQKILNKILYILKSGKRIVQSTHTKIGLYNVMSWYEYENNIFDKLTQGECGVVLNSGFFKHRREKDLIFWDFVL